MQLVLMAVLMLFVVVVLLWLPPALRGRSRELPLAERERMFVLLSPIPVFFSIALPGSFSALRLVLDGSVPRLPPELFTLLGLGASLALAVTGAWLTIRSLHNRRGRLVLVLSTILAAFPVVLLSVVWAMQNTT